MIQPRCKDLGSVESRYLQVRAGSTRAEVREENETQEEGSQGIWKGHFTLFLSSLPSSDHLSRLFFHFFLILSLSPLICTQKYLYFIVCLIFQARNVIL